MSQFLSVKFILRIVATTAFSIFSYAAMAHSAPSIDSCSQALSSFQKRLYAHFLAGPESLRNYIFRVRGVHLLDIHEVDEWARNVSAQTCPARDASAATDDEVRAAPTHASTSARDSAIQISAGGAGSDGCTTNVLDVMHCSGPGERTREAVVAELRNARATGDLLTVGELSNGTWNGGIVPSTAVMATTRTSVKSELAVARAAHMLQFGER